jgi:hypothetical protein
MEGEKPFVLTVDMSPDSELPRLVTGRSRPKCLLHADAPAAAICYPPYAPVGCGRPYADGDHGLPVLLPLPRVPYGTGLSPGHPRPDGRRHPSAVSGAGIAARKLRGTRQPEVPGMARPGPARWCAFRTTTLYGMPPRPHVQAVYY